MRNSQKPTKRFFWYNWTLITLTVLSVLAFVVGTTIVSTSDYYRPIDVEFTVHEKLHYTSGKSSSRVHVIIGKTDRYMREFTVSVYDYIKFNKGDKVVFKVPYRLYHPDPSKELWLVHVPAGMMAFGIVIAMLCGFALAVCWPPARRSY